MNKPLDHLRVVDRRDPESLVPLSEVALQVLISLSDKDLHGYAILGAIDRRGAGPAPSTSTLYGALKRMLRDGLVEESDYRPDPDLDDQRRRYYRITSLGRHVLRLEAERIGRLAESIRRLELG